MEFEKSRMKIFLSYFLKYKETLLDIYSNSCSNSLTSSTLGVLPSSLTSPFITNAGSFSTPYSKILGISLIISKSSSRLSSVKAASTMGATLLPPQHTCSKILISINTSPSYLLKIFLISSFDGTLPDNFNSPSTTRPGVFITP